MIETISQLGKSLDVDVIGPLYTQGYIDRFVNVQHALALHNANQLSIQDRNGLTAQEYVDRHFNTDQVRAKAREQAPHCFIGLRRHHTPKIALAYSVIHDRDIDTDRTNYAYISNTYDTAATDLHVALSDGNALFTYRNGYDDRGTHRYEPNKDALKEPLQNAADDIAYTPTAYLDVAVYETLSRVLDTS
jgi:hypothetical protein